jgi:hypothetical protein
MAYYLTFDGSNDYVLAPFSESMAQTFQIKIRFKTATQPPNDKRMLSLSGTGSRPLMTFGTGSNNNEGRVFFATDSNSTEIQTNFYFPFGDDVFHDLTLFMSNGTLTGSVDGGTQFSLGTYTPADYTITQVSFGAIYRSSVSDALEFDLAHVIFSGDITRNYDSTASSGTGLLLPNTLDNTGATDGDLNNFSGTTNSWWVSYTPSGAKTVTIVETSPSFTDSITANVTSISLITASIAEIGPIFTDSITATSTSSTSGVNNWGAVNTWSSSLGISLSVSESGPSFTDSISISVTSVGLITASILEYAPSFSDSVATVVTGNIVTSIVGAGPSFTDAVSITVTTPQQINISIVESGPSFIESILMSTPTAWVDKVPKTTAWTDRAISSTIWQDK